MLVLNKLWKTLSPRETPISGRVAFLSHQTFLLDNPQPTTLFVHPRNYSLLPRMLAPSFFVRRGPFIPCPNFRNTATLSFAQPAIPGLVDKSLSRG